jgi:hypothetical protein
MDSDCTCYLLRNGIIRRADLRRGLHRLREVLAREARGLKLCLIDRIDLALLDRADGVVPGVGPRLMP